MEFVEYEIMRDLDSIGNDAQYADRLPCFVDYPPGYVMRAVKDMLSKGWLSGELGGTIQVTEAGYAAMEV